jgi:hypothetical protein
MLVGPATSISLPERTHPWLAVANVNQHPPNFQSPNFRNSWKRKYLKNPRSFPDLKKRQSDLQAELDEIETEIRAIEMISPSAAKAPPKKRGPKPGAKRRRPGTAKAAKSDSKKAPKRRAGKGGKMTVKQAIHTVLSDAGKAMTTEEIREAVKGRKLLKKYSTSYPQQIALALSQGGFKRVKRGVYSL